MYPSIPPLPDPTAPAKPAPLEAFGRKISVQGLLEQQLQIAADLQSMIKEQRNNLSPRDYRDLATSTSNLIALAHRTDHMLRTTQTYQAFVDVVMEFLRKRSDDLGEDLLEELRESAKELRAEAELDTATGLSADNESWQVTSGKSPA